MRAAGLTPPPQAGQRVSLPAVFGYIEAYTIASDGGADVLWGVATPLSVSGGFSSSYTAAALVDFDARDETATTAGNAQVAAALAREGGVDKEVLHTRYTADPQIGSSTQLVLTFPTGHQPGEGDPLSAFFFDSDEQVSFSPREVVLPWETNVCTIAREGQVTTFQCPTTSTLPVNKLEVVGPGGTFTGGWVRLLDTGLGAEVDGPDAPPVTRLPVLGLVFSTFGQGGSRQFDQSFPIHWAAVVGAGGVGNESLLAGAASFAPWVLPDGMPITPGDNSSGGLPLTGAPQP